MRVVRILGTLEPGGAQLSALRLSVALRRRGSATILLAGDATRRGWSLPPLRPARGRLPGKRGHAARQRAVDARARVRRRAWPQARPRPAWCTPT